MKKYAFLGVIAGVLVVSSQAARVSAHVVVQPASVGVGDFQTFSVGVPSEKDFPTVQVRVIVPEGVRHVTPTVKSGWTIDVVKEGEGEEAAIKEILWSGGAIPAGQRDDFTFSAQVPSSETSLQWKAYQTYQDGSTVAWDQDPAGSSHGDSSFQGPYSVTHIVNDLGEGTAQAGANSKTGIVSVLLSLAALGVAVFRTSAS